MALQGEPVAHNDLVDGSQTTLHSHAGGGGGATISVIMRRDSAGGQNINAASTNNLVNFATTQFSRGSGLTAASDRITVTTAGDVKVWCNLAINSASTRYNGRVWIRKNGTTDLFARGKSFYVRNTSGHTESSAYVAIWDSASVNDYYQVLVDRESSASTTMNTAANESMFCVELIT